MSTHFTLCKSILTCLLIFNNFVLRQLTRALPGIKNNIWLVSITGGHDGTELQRKVRRTIGVHQSRRFMFLLLHRSCICQSQKAKSSAAFNREVRSNGTWSNSEWWTVFPKVTWYFKTVVKDTFSIPQINGLSLLMCWSVCLFVYSCVLVF